MPGRNALRSERERPTGRTNCEGSCSAAYAVGGCREVGTTTVSITFAASRKEYALRKDNCHPKAVYLRADRVLGTIDGWIASIFDPKNLDATAAALAAGNKIDETTILREEVAKKRLKDADQKLAQYRKAIESGADAKIVAGWMKEVTAQKALAELELESLPRPQHMTPAQVKRLVLSLKGIPKVLMKADPKIKAELYSQLGMTLTYHPERRVVTVEARPDPCEYERVGAGI